MEYGSHSFGAATRIEGKVICAGPDNQSFVEYIVNCDSIGCARDVYVRYEEAHGWKRRRTSTVRSPAVIRRGSKWMITE